MEMSYWLSFSREQKRGKKKIIKHKVCGGENEKQSRGKTSKLEINNKNLKH